MTRSQPNLLRTRLRTGLRTGLASAVLAGSLMLALPADASAQAAGATQQQRVTPPRPQQPNKPPVIKNFLVAGVVVISIVAATVIPAKRGHQD
ncbi:MAG: hypothetical protein NCW75_02385 [Phycisphaera sp.]|nr:MAG: hypothetical protein NCW75_02385 [Phycisphaera sp.]